MSITLYPFVLLHVDLETAKRTRLLHHELVHVDQIRELGFLRFYFSYLVEFARHYWRLRSWKRAYLSISFERDAYRKQYEKNLPPQIL